MVSAVYEISIQAKRSCSVWTCSFVHPQGEGIGSIIRRDLCHSYSVRTNKLATLRGRYGAEVGSSVRTGPARIVDHWVSRERPLPGGLGAEADVARDGTREMTWTDDRNGTPRLSK